jgi:phage shock protein PspC (stress-responsive transcriptional regulator)
MTEQQPYQPPQQPPQQAPQQPPFQAPSQPPYRRLTRTTWDAPVSGVCGGIARYLGVDPTLVRVLAVIAMVFTFPVGPIVYAVLWAVIPKE